MSEVPLQSELPPPSRAQFVLLGFPGQVDGGTHIELGKERGGKREGEREGEREGARERGRPKSWRVHLN